MIDVKTKIFTDFDGQEQAKSQPGMHNISSSQKNNPLLQSHTGYKIKS